MTLAKNHTSKRGDLSDFDYLESALSLSGAMPDVSTCLDWISQRRDAIDSNITRIDFDQLRKWGFDDSGNIRHESGQFFSIQGLHVSEFPHRPTAWDQPIIRQDEIGILGFIAKKIDGVLHLMIQAKIEPGNVNLVQLSPTLQATRSNFLRVHGGKTPNYLSYFRSDEPIRTRFDQFQSEQGSRFLDKRNRNLIVEVDEQQSIESYDDYCWMTIGQLKALSRFDNLINMDSRSILSGINYAESATVKRTGIKIDPDEFGSAILTSMEPDVYKKHSDRELLGWVTHSRFASQFNTKMLGLDEVCDWKRHSNEFSSPKHNFSVIATEVAIGNREVISWTQPMMQQQHPELFGFLVQRKNGILHFLAQVQPEAGLRSKAEIGPTVQCCPQRELIGEGPHCRHFLDLFTDANPDQIRVDSLQSEEGGRFYQEQNRNMVVELDSVTKLDHPETFRWVTLGQLLSLGRHANYLNIQARSVISLLDVNYERTARLIKEIH